MAAPKRRWDQAPDDPAKAVREKVQAQLAEKGLKFASKVRVGPLTAHSAPLTAPRAGWSVARDRDQRLAAPVPADEGHTARRGAPANGRHRHHQGHVRGQPRRLEGARAVSAGAGHHAGDGGRRRRVARQGHERPDRARGRRPASRVPDGGRRTAAAAARCAASVGAGAAAAARVARVRREGVCGRGAQRGAGRRLLAHRQALWPGRCAATRSHTVAHRLLARSIRSNAQTLAYS